MIFNRNPIKFGSTIEQPSSDLIRNTLGLVNASVEDAVRYGGDITKAALGVMNLKNDRKNIVVDVKVHMLMKGMCPAIPGWHTDGVPRSSTGSPQGSETPDPYFQDDLDEMGQGTHYHLLVTGVGCLTQFMQNDDTEIDVDLENMFDLYKSMTKQVDQLTVLAVSSPSCQVVEWDWWNIHQGIIATANEWRYLIRVTETDFLTPERDLRKVIRSQQQVYAPLEFGW